MTDSVGPLLPDLLAEIGRLRGEVERLTAERANRYWEGRWRDEAAEVERLTAERNEGARWRRQGEAELRAEVERLRIENAALRRALELKP